MNLNGPNAGSDAMPCPECPEQYLDAYLKSPKGQLISVVIDLNFALQSRIDVPLAAIPYPEFVLLAQLCEEREKHQAEEMKRKH